MKKLFLFMFISLMLLSLVSADKISNVDTGATEGLQIFTPQFEAIKYNTSYNVHIHVSNISTGYPLTNDLVSCYLHLYGSDGSHTYERNTPLEKDTNNIDHELTITYGNFTQAGEINSYYIWCNTTYLGGEVKGSYEITENGRNRPDGIIILGFSIVLIFFLMTLIVYVIKAVGTIIEANFDILDVAYAYGLYFGLLGVTQLEKIYLGNVEVGNWLNLFVTWLGFPLIILPVLAFFLSLFRMKKQKKREEQERPY